MTTETEPTGASTEPERTLRRRSRKAKGCLIALAAPLLPIAYFMSRLHNYMSWLMMDVASLNHEIDSHMRGVHGDTEYACLYVVSCESGGARLDLRTKLSPADLSHIKSEIWRRRFENYCAGPVTNFGLEHAGTPDHTPRDCYNFGAGFGGATGLAAGCAFTEYSRSTPCTRELAYWSRERGIIRSR